MRNVYSFLFVLLFLCMLLIPLAARGESTPSSAYKETSSTPESEEKETGEQFIIKVGDDLVTLSASEYITGVVAAEMPALYHDEALKAQAVAAYTYALYKRDANKEKGYDLTADSATDQAFADDTAQREKWGAKYDEYRQRISAAVTAVEGEFVSFDGKPILAAYHAISSGKTETAAAVWGRDYPYLQTVESEGDRLSDGYLADAVFSPEKLCELLEIEGPLAAEDSTIGEIERSDCGTVRRLTIGGHGFTGSSLRAALSLRSSNFDLCAREGSFVFTTRGYGHGVGMSQFGADFLADRGYTYKEILSHYYKGAQIEKK